MKKILLTGATGFVGQELLKELIKQQDVELRVAVRSRAKANFDSALKVYPLMDLSLETNWLNALEGCNLVIHTAARVHVMKEKAADPLLEFRKINVEGTLTLARLAAQSGVARFIFLSSIKVNGEFTTQAKPFAANDVPNPSDPYAISKYEAEQGLLEIAKKTGMEVVIIRPPLVYGPGVKGNFLTMITCMRKGIPLPLGAITNKRSFVAIDNLISLIITCLDHPAAANQVFLVSDGDDLSTTDLLKKIGLALKKPSRLLPIPQNILNLLAILSGQKAIYQRLCGDLQLDISSTCRTLDWQPKVTVMDALAMTLKK